MPINGGAADVARERELAWPVCAGASMRGKLLIYFLGLFAVTTFAVSVKRRFNGPNEPPSPLAEPAVWL